METSTLTLSAEAAAALKTILVTVVVEMAFTHARH
jgi:hypothetical protein